MLCSTFHEYAAAFKIFKLPIHPITVQTTQFSRSAMAGAETPKLAGSELRHDSILNKWVIISPARGKRPSDFKSTVNTSNQSAGPCPFCLHHEHECAPEIFRIPENVSEWKVRVIKNLYPAVSMENREKEPHIDSCADTLPGFGSHDVIIETPDHAMTLAIMPDLNIFDVLCAYRTRIQQLAGNLHIKYIQVFKNHGETAGASMKHSHSQIIALPIVPSNVVTRLNNAKEYFTRTMKCNLSSFPFETWIAPKEHASRYEQIEDEQDADYSQCAPLGDHETLAAAWERIKQQRRKWTPEIRAEVKAALLAEHKHLTKTKTEQQNPQNIKETVQTSRKTKEPILLTTIVAEPVHVPVVTKLDPPIVQREPTPGYRLLSYIELPDQEEPITGSECSEDNENNS
ncbi:ADP-glucose phosphorylase isoform X2 [Cryptomeria japonica]|uniref:ADP-glucose phosphorylase isoform X2 n=1 Tax=Cryptomeria japonica TaxID=3369 RepID=UPI0027D9DB3A|nr:ADP-glucose phosphorylase isoform X2 [Cryptomeria japonica]